MTNKEIQNYLISHNYSVDPQDCLMKVFNTSPQIQYNHYDHNTGTMTIGTEGMEFTFKWNLKKY